MYGNNFYVRLYMNKTKCSQAGRALAECRWGKKKAKKKATGPPRRSNRLAGKEPARQPEPKKKPRKKRPKKKAPKRTAAGKKVEEILVPGLNPKRGDMRTFLDQQRAQWLR